MNYKMQFDHVPGSKQIRISRSFRSSVKSVWDAYTKSEILDKWWAPHPYKNKTKSMNFTEGGTWHYAMIGPKGDVHWCMVQYLKINVLKSFEAADSFCDENGVKNSALPSMHWNNVFGQEGKDTTLNITITASSAADIETIVKMGFREGFEAGLNQLDTVLKDQS